MSKLSEKLVILQETGTGLLVRLHDMKRNLTTPASRPSFLNDPSYAKIMNAFKKKFPDVPDDLDRIQGYDVLQQRSKSLYDELESYYWIFVDCLEFRQYALSTLLDVATNVVSLNLQQVRHCTYYFFQVLVKYIRIHALMAQIQDRKALIGLYGRTHFSVHRKEDDDFLRVSQYVAEFDAPFSRLRDEFASISGRIGPALLSLKDDYFRALDINMARKEGYFSLTMHPEKQTKAADDYFSYFLLHVHEITNWIAFCFLLAPEEFALNGAFDLVKHALSNQFAFPLFRSDLIALHEEYEKLFKSYKSTSKPLTKQLRKEAKAINETLHQAVSGDGPGGLRKGPKYHQDCRNFLREEMGALCRLFEDYPGLLGPKASLALAALTWSKHELLWFFSHTSATAPKGSSRHYKEENYRDDKLLELIHWHLSLNQLLHQYSRVIQAYYIEYLAGLDKKHLQAAYDEHLSGTDGLVGSNVKKIISAVQQVNLDDFMNNQAAFDFKGIRVDWYRAEYQSSTSHSTKALGAMKSLSSTMNQVCMHADTVDFLMDWIDDKVSLKDLYFFGTDRLQSMFTYAVSHASALQSGVLSSYFSLLTKLPFAATIYYPEEKETIGHHVSDLANRAIGLLVKEISGALTVVIEAFIKNENQLDWVNANRLDTQPSGSVTKRGPAIVVPGSESEYKNRMVVQQLRGKKRLLENLLAAVNATPFVDVYDKRYVLQEFLRESLSQLLRNKLVAYSTVPNQDKEMSIQVCRPSIYLRHLNVILGSFMFVETFMDLDMVPLIREVLTEQIYHPEAKEVSLDWARPQKTDWGGISTVTSNYAQFYADFLNHKLSSHTTFIYSPARMSFVSNRTSNFNAEEYLQLDEMVALASLLGPGGIRLVEREALKVIHRELTSVKEILTLNRAVLQEIATNYTRETACNESLKKLQNVEQFIHHAIYIGKVLNFQRLLGEGLNKATKDTLPHLYTAVKDTFKEYTRNCFRMEEFVPMDMLAKDCGLVDALSDQPLQHCLKDICGGGGADTWNLLPVLFAVSFANTRAWYNAVYLSSLEGHSNNAHVLAQSISSLIIASKALTVPMNPDGVPLGNVADIQNMHLDFLDIAATILLRFARQHERDVASKQKIRSFPSVFIILDQFAQESPLITRDMISNVVPYSLIRSFYKDVYATFGKDAGAES